jgi:hypothetical protein
MKPQLLALAAIGALAIAAPGHAQNGYYNSYSSGQYQNGYSNNGYNNGYGYDVQLSSSTAIESQIARLDQRLQAGIRSGTIDRSEAMRLRAELRDLRRMNQQYSSGGLSAQDRAYLADRLRSVREDIRTADNGSWDRYDRDQSGSGGSSYGYSNGSEGTYGGSTYGNGSYGRTYGNGYSSGSSGTYGNGYGRTTDNGYYGQGGPYEEVDASATLRVGDAVSGGLYGVPYNLRSRYRDGYGYYYRSDGRAIYQIDSRSNTVMQVYPIDR